MQCACVVLNCHLCPLWLYHIFSRYLINGTILGKLYYVEVLEDKSTTYVRVILY